MNTLRLLSTAQSQSADVNPRRRRAAPRLRQLALALLLGGGSLAAHAGLFDDEEARRAILDLRARIDALQAKGDARDVELRKFISEGDSKRGAQTSADIAAATKDQAAQLTTQITTQMRAEFTQSMTEQFDQLRRSLLDLNNQLEAMRGELAKQRGQDEVQQQGLRELGKDVAEMQRKSTDQATTLEARLRRLEPQKLSLDGREVLVEADEKKSYDEAVALLRNNDFAGSIAGLQTFIRRYPASAFVPHAVYWLATAHYSKGDLKDAMAGYRNVITGYPEHPRAPEAMLALANCQAEAKDIRGARRTLEDLVRSYPQSEAAAAGRDRIAMLR
ncbi:MAG: tol-pal system protein YbgF [Pseudomonadota bacterium]|jgi:tol-pal system protein YbgF